MTAIGIGIVNLFFAWISWKNMPRLAGANLGIGIVNIVLGIFLLIN